MGDVVLSRMDFLLSPPSLLHFERLLSGPFLLLANASFSLQVLERLVFDGHRGGFMKEDLFDEYHEFTWGVDEYSPCGRLGW
jgi:hypothetical protein